MSGSMAPRVLPGDAVVARPITHESLVPGQVLLVRDPDHQGRLRLHRFVRLDSQGRLILRGDANAQADSTPVDWRAVRGVAALRVPWIGREKVWLAQGRAAEAGAALGAFLALALLAAWPSPLADRRASRSRTRPRQATTQRALRSRLSQLTVLTLIAALLWPESYETFAAVTANAADSWVSTYWTCAGGIHADNAYFAYPLAEASGSSAADATGNGHDGSYASSGVTHTMSMGPCSSSRHPVATLDGSSGYISYAGLFADPETYTESVWFRTTQGGGKLFGFSGQIGGGGQNDRHIYMTMTGHLVFGVYSNGFHTAPTTTTAIDASPSFNDGTWHQVVATQSGPSSTYPGIRLYVDGRLIAADPSTSLAEPHSGYFSVGYCGNINAWPEGPSNPYFTGSVAWPSYYQTALSPSQIAQQYQVAMNAS